MGMGLMMIQREVIKNLFIDSIKTKKKFYENDNNLTQVNNVVKMRRKYGAIKCCRI